MYQRVMWTNGNQCLVGAVVEDFSASGRKKVSIQFQDGRWFEGVPHKALTASVNWMFIDEVVSQAELDAWKAKAKNLSTQLYAVGLEMIVDVDWPRRTKRKIVRVATVSASCIETAKLAAVRHFESEKRKVLPLYAKLCEMMKGLKAPFDLIAVKLVVQFRKFRFPIKRSVIFAG